MMSMVDRIRILAEEKRTTLAGIERDLNLGQGSIRKWDASSPSVEKVDRIAKYFNVSLDYILGKTDARDSYMAKKNAPATPVITAKDEKDIAKNLEKIMAELDNDESGPLCYGGEISDTTKELLKGALEQALRIAKIENKEKYTPHKYRK